MDEKRAQWMIYLEITFAELFMFAAVLASLLDPTPEIEDSSPVKPSRAIQASDALAGSYIFVWTALGALLEDVPASTNSIVVILLIMLMVSMLGHPTNRSWTSTESLMRG